MNIAVLPAALAPATAAADQDANLQLDRCTFPELAARLDRVYAKWTAQRAVDSIDQARFEARVFAETGIHFADAPEPERDEETDELDPYWAARERISRLMDRDDDATEIWDKIHGEMYDVIEHIMSAPVATLADLAIQARAAALANHEFFLGPDHFDAPELRELAESISRFSGVALFPDVDRSSAETIACAGTSSPAVAPDPVFAAIDAHRRAIQRYSEAVTKQDEIESADIANGKRRTTERQQAEREVEAAADTMEAAAVDVLNAEPTTYAGVMALLTYAHEQGGEGTCVPSEVQWEASPADGASWGDHVYLVAAAALSRLSGVEAPAVPALQAWQRGLQRAAAG